MLTLGQELVDASGNVLDDEGSLRIGECYQTRTNDQHHGPVDWAAALIERHLPLHRTPTLAEGRAGDGTRDDERRKHCLSE